MFCEKFRLIISSELYNQRIGDMDEMKLIGIDLDGTLLNSDQSISQKNARTMKHLPEDCFPFICSGREVEDINNILKKSGLRIQQ